MADSRATAWRLLTDPQGRRRPPAETIADFTQRLAELIGPAQAAAALRPALGDAVPLPPERVLQARLLARRARHHQLTALRLLSGAGVPLVVVKGFALAHRYCDEPLDRIGDDVDLLLPAGEIDRAVRLLTSAGWRFAGPPLPAWGRTATVSLPPLAPPDHSTSVDLHREADEWPFARALPARKCFDIAEPFAAEDLRLSSLPPTESLLLAVSNAAKDKFGPFALRKLLDVLLLLRGGEIDPLRLRGLADRAGLGRPLAVAGYLLQGLGLRPRVLPHLPDSAAARKLLHQWEGLFDPPPGRWQGLLREARFGPGWRFALGRNARRLGGLARRRS